MDKIERVALGMAASTFSSAEADASAEAYL